MPLLRVTQTEGKDKPYRAWKRVRVLCDGKTNLDHAVRLKEVVAFAFKHFEHAEVADKTPVQTDAATQR